MVAVTCVFCGEPYHSKEWSDITKHTARCMFDHCAKDGTQCYCTCPDCKGVSFHPSAESRKKRRSSALTDIEKSIFEVETKLKALNYSDNLIYKIFPLVIEFLPAPVDLKALSLVSKEIFSLVRPVISSTCKFNLTRQTEEFKFYKPQKLVIAGDLQRLKSSLPLPPNPTYFGVYPSLDFVVPVEDLPDAVTHLALPDQFNSPVPRWPRSLKFLNWLGGTTPRDIVNLPESLLELRVGSLNNTDTRKLNLPQSLTKLLILGGLYDFGPTLVLPPSLQELAIYMPQTPQIQFPASLRMFVCQNLNQALPSLPNLTHLELRGLYTHQLPPLPMLKFIDLGVYIQPLPPTAVPSLDLTIHDAFNHPLPPLPATLENIQLGNAYNQPLPALPAALTSLEIGDEFDQPLPVLPSSLLTLKLGEMFNQPLPPLPANLKVLRLGEQYNEFTHPLQPLPATLETLSISNFHAIIPPLPSTLRKLEMQGFDGVPPELPGAGNICEWP